MTEDQQPDREPEEATDAASADGTSSGTGLAAGSTEKVDTPRSPVLMFALAASVVCMKFLWGLTGKSMSKQYQPATAVPRCPCEEANGAGDSSPVVEENILERQSDAEVARRRKWGTPLVLCAFAVGMAGGIAFIFLYWTGGSNQLLGVTLALCLGGFGAVLVLYAHWMIRHELVIAPREEMSSNEDERKEAFQDYSSGAYDVQRRGLLKWMGTGAVGLFAVIVFSMLRSLARTDPADSLFTTVWKHGQRLMTVGGKPLTVDSLQPGSSMTVFPETSVGSQKSQTVLIRVDQNLLRLPKARAGWAPMGYVAYSRVCTHAGCAVGMFEAHSNLLLCPCHQSTFDVLRGAVPTGGPAARALPQLPLYVDSDGILRAGGGFSSPPGPGFTGMPS